MINTAYVIRCWYKDGSRSVSEGQLVAIDSRGEIHLTPHLARAFLWNDTADAAIFRDKFLGRYDTEVWRVGLTMPESHLE